MKHHPSFHHHLLGTPGVPRTIRVNSIEDPNNANRITVRFEWGIPLELAGNPIDEIRYKLRFCNIDDECVVKTTLDRFMNFDDREAGLTYTYNITTLRADGGLGESAAGEFNSNIGMMSFLAYKDYIRLVREWFC